MEGNCTNQFEGSIKCEECGETWSICKCKGSDKTGNNHSQELHTQGDKIVSPNVEDVVENIRQPDTKGSDKIGCGNCGHDKEDHRIMANEERGYCNHNRRECDCREFKEELGK